MKLSPLDAIINTVLYEGYILYPYRPSSVKNRQRWSFGGLAPSACPQETSASQTQCLTVSGPFATISIRVRFLHPVERVVRTFAPHAGWCTVDSLRVGDELYQSWQEAVEQEAILPPLTPENMAGSRVQTFSFPAARAIELIALPDGTLAGALDRAREEIILTVTMSAVRVEPEVYRVTVRVENISPIEEVGVRSAVELRSALSVHMILAITGGRFISAIDPPEKLRKHAEGCRNVGVWPVLVGEEGQADTVLASPIILYDYPRVAPESPGDAFDGTEIDELLALRIQTLTNDEKRAMLAADPRARDLLGRTEALAREQLAALHGTVRERRRAGFRPGDRVRLRPRGRADAFDVLLAGRPATVSAVEHDYEGRPHVAVTVDDDPGRDLGAEGKPGHRFFFTPEELEPLGDGP